MATHPKEDAPEPQPGQTWIHHIDGTEIIVAEVGSTRLVRGADDELHNEYDPNQIGWWTVKEDNCTHFTGREDFLAEFIFVPDAQDKWHKHEDTIYLPPMEYVIQPWADNEEADEDSSDDDYK